MAFKMNDKLWEIIINYMENNPAVATQKFTGGLAGRKLYKTKWTELTILLNAAGYGQRTTTKWQKTWTDFKYNLKKKASNIKQVLQGPGSSSALKNPLTDLEERALNIIGKNIYKGIGSSEIGVSPVKAESAFEPIPSISEDEHDTYIEIAFEPVSSTSPDQPNAYLFEKMDSSQVSSEPSSPGSTPRSTEHSYSFPPPSKLRKIDRQENEEFQKIYKDTVESLKNIEQTLQTELPLIRKGIEAIAAAIKKKK